MAIKTREISGDHMDVVKLQRSLILLDGKQSKQIWLKSFSLGCQTSVNTVPSDVCIAGNKKAAMKVILQKAFRLLITRWPDRKKGYLFWNISVNG